MKLYLVDGTYELFRHYFGAPKKQSPDGREVGAVGALLRGTASWLRKERIEAIGVAFDTVVESFRNDLFDGYKSSEGVPEDLLSQFPLAEEAMAALGLKIWPMREFEADDAIATAARHWAGRDDFDQILICSPDKDFSQCVTGRRVVCLDRRKERITDEEGVRERFGVSPKSVPDWQALVGDSADGYPGIRGWGQSSTTAVLSAYGRLEAIPEDPAEWDPSIRRREKLSEALRDGWDEALLYRRLATLRTDVPIEMEYEDLLWKGPRPELRELSEKLGTFTIADF